MTQAFKIGAEFQVNTQTSGDQDAPAITALSATRFVATWEDWSGRDGDSSIGVNAQVFDVGGGGAVKFGPEFRMNTQTAGGQLAPENIALSDSRFVATWHDQSGDGDHDNRVYLDIFARAPTAAQVEHFNVQIAYFEALYQSVQIPLGEATKLARGAVFGQMVGHAVLHEPDEHSYDEVTSSFFKSVVSGQVHFGDPLNLT